MPPKSDRSGTAEGAVAWEEQLADAFELILGRSLDTYDTKATYVLYHWDDVMSSELFYHLKDASLLGSTVSGLAFGAEDHPFSVARWNRDIGRSLISLDDHHTLIPAVVSALRTASSDDSEVVLTGAALAQALAGSQDLPEDVFLTLIARVVTSGTFFDALRAATWTMGGPADLAPAPTEAEIDADWEPVLARVAHPALRGHLSHLFLDAQWARSEGAYYSGVGKPPTGCGRLVEEPGHEFVTGWEFGEGQASSAIFAVRDAEAPST